MSSFLVPVLSLSIMFFEPTFQSAPLGVRANLTIAEAFQTSPPLTKTPPTVHPLQAIYPLHFADEDSKRRNPTAYYDAAIVSIINTHNAMVEEAWSPNPELAELEDIAVLI